MSSEEKRARVKLAVGALLGRLPDLDPSVPGDPAARRLALKEVIRDAGRDLRRLRSLPRVETAPLMAIRQACREALAALHAIERGQMRLARACRAIARNRPAREG